VTAVLVCGTDTDVGKTVFAAALVQALDGCYWKPIQAGDLENSDSHKIQSLISNSKKIPGAFGYLPGT